MLYVQEACGAIKIGRQAKAYLFIWVKYRGVILCRVKEDFIKYGSTRLSFGNVVFCKQQTGERCHVFLINFVNIIHALVDGYILKFNDKRNHHTFLL